MRSDCELSSLGQRRAHGPPAIVLAVCGLCDSCTDVFTGLRASQLAGQSAFSRWLKWTATGTCTRPRGVVGLHRADFPSSPLCVLPFLPSFSFQLTVTSLCSNPKHRPRHGRVPWRTPPCTPTPPLSLLTVPFDLLSGKVLQCGDRSLPSSCTNESEDRRE